MSEVEADTDLGEVLGDNEEDLAQKIADAIAAKVSKTAADRKAKGEKFPALRDAHPRAHGCVRAEFRVEDDLPPYLAQGVFQPGASYPAYIRFSNGSSDPSRPDALPDARGMAIKLLNVPGEKILPGERDALTQDFIMINHPVFFIDDPAHYLKAVEALGNPNLLTFLRLILALGLIGAKELKTRSDAVASSKIASPLQTRYWSQVPYRLGDPPHKQAIKFSARPRRPKAAVIPDDPEPNFLRQTLIKQLKDGEAQFDFELQPRTLPSMSVETSTLEWEEAEAPFYKVATIMIPQQDFATPEQDELGENLSFTPWHALPQHRPLGAVNRIRRIVYDRISKLRHEINGKERREPAP